MFLFLFILTIDRSRDMCFGKQCKGPGEVCGRGVNLNHGSVMSGDCARINRHGTGGSNECDVGDEEEEAAVGWLMFDAGRVLFAAHVSRGGGVDTGVGGGEVGGGEVGGGEVGGDSSGGFKGVDNFRAEDESFEVVVAVVEYCVDMIFFEIGENY